MLDSLDFIEGFGSATDLRDALVGRGRAPAERETRFEPVVCGATLTLGLVLLGVAEI